MIGSPTHDHRPCICFVAHYAYGAICGGSAGHVGGIEWQQSIMARWLASRGFRVSMLTWDEGQPDGIVIEGVRIHKMCRREAGLRGPRFVHPRWTSLNAALRRADADVYYQNCGEYVTGQVALWCRRNGRRFVYSVASDPDCDSGLPEMNKLRERLLYRYGLCRAHCVIVQTRNQQKMLRAGFGREGVVMPMPCPGPVEGTYVSPLPPVQGSGRLVWAGRLVEVKRLELLLDVAEAMTDVQFDIAGVPGSQTRYSRWLEYRARALPNVTLHGRVARDEMADFYKRTSCLCCTSAFEGFPNTFLEAWSHGLPVVSTVDPDNVIVRHGLGAVAEDGPGLVRAIRDLLQSPERWRSASRNARKYYVENHAVEVAMPRFERLFLEVVGQKTYAAGGGREASDCNASS